MLRQMRQNRKKKEKRNTHAHLFNAPNMNNMAMASTINVYYIYINALISDYGERERKNGKKCIRASLVSIKRSDDYSIL